MFNKVKQFKDMRSQAKEIERILGEEKVEGTALHNKVKIVMDGNQSVVTVSIEPEALENKEKLQDAIKDATNDAAKKVKRILMMKMQKGEIQMPNF